MAHKYAAPIAMVKKYPIACITNATLSAASGVIPQRLQAGRTLVLMGADKPR